VSFHSAFRVNCKRPDVFSYYQIRHSKKQYHFDTIAHQFCTISLPDGSDAMVVRPLLLGWTGLLTAQLGHSGAF